MNKKVRWLVVGAAVVVVLSGMAVFIINETKYSKQVEAVAGDQSASEKMLKQIEKQITELYAEGSTEFLTPDISQEKMDLLAASITKYQEKSKAYDEKIKNLRKNDQKKHQFNVNFLSGLWNEMKIIQKKFDAQQAVNALFQKSYLSGTEVKNAEIIIDNLSAKKVADVKKAYFQDEIDEKDEKQDFQTTINKGIELAENQVKQIEKANKAVSELYKDDKVTDKATKETFDTVKKEVQAIKNEKARKSFDAALKAIEEKVKADEAAKEEAEKQAEEAKRQEEQAVTQEVIQMTETPATDEPTVTPEPPVQNTNEPVATQPVAPTVPPVSSGNNSGTTNNPSGGSSSADTGSSSTGGNIGSGSGGSNSGGNTGGSSGGTTPTPPAPEKPYALNPYTGSGKMYTSYAAAASDGEKWMMESTNATGGYRVYTEYWSDSTEKYYLELY